MSCARNKAGITSFVCSVRVFWRNWATEFRLLQTFGDRCLKFHQILAFARTAAYELNMNSRCNQDRWNVKDELWEVFCKKNSKTRSAAGRQISVLTSITSQNYTYPTNSAFISKACFDLHSLLATIQVIKLQHKSRAMIIINDKSFCEVVQLVEHAALKLVDTVRFPVGSYLRLKNGTGLGGRV